LLDTARAIRFQAGSPKQFWGECILAATHIINKLPMANLQWRSPFEVLYGHAPSIEDLRAIGCLCYAASIGERDKFAARARRCVLLGYTFGFKGYRLHELETKKVFHSRDVIFQEQIFPFKEHAQPVSTNNPASSFIWPDSHMFPAFIDSYPTSTSVEHGSLSHNIAAPTDNLHVSDSLPSSSSSSIHPADQLPASENMISTDSPGLRESPKLQPLDLRRSTRSRIAPTWLKDFIQPRSRTQQQDSSHSHSFHSVVVHPLLHTADLHYLSQDFVTSLLSVMHVAEPYSYSQAKESPEWTATMDKELEALEANGTWRLTALPPKARALTSKWVYRVKFRPDGSIERYKARLVIRGFQQIKDKDYKHTFSPVAKLTTVRIFIALATAKGWPLHQLDINNAFLHGFIDEEVYMYPPEGYHKAAPGQVCKLERSLYGLKQASRQ